MYKNTHFSELPTVIFGLRCDGVISSTCFHRVNFEDFVVCLVPRLLRNGVDDCQIIEAYKAVEEKKRPKLGPGGWYKTFLHPFGLFRVSFRERRENGSCNYEGSAGGFEHYKKYIPHIPTPSPGRRFCLVQEMCADFFDNIKKIFYVLEI